MQGIGNLAVIGWREWVNLPQLCSTSIKAKVDTGARTSSLHVDNLSIETREKDEIYAVYTLFPEQDNENTKVDLSTKVIEFRTIKSSNGILDTRPVIETQIKLGNNIFETQITLASRDNMGFRMLLGRESIKNIFVVDPDKSFLLKDIEL